MPPLFLNPHSLPDFTFIVPRNQIYIDEPNNNKSLSEKNADLHRQLDSLIHTSWQVVPFSDTTANLFYPEAESNRVDEEPTMFRLFSNAPMRSILLQPKISQQLTARGPETEDTEEQASLRKIRAESIAIEPSDVLNNSGDDTIHSAREIRKLQHLRVDLTITPPTMMIIDQSQYFWSEQPASSKPRRLSFNNGVSMPPPVQSKACLVVKCCSAPHDASKKRKHRKRKLRSKQRTQPSFWRPDPVIGGKSVGYAFGYPCSLEALHGSANTIKYHQDTMKTCVPSW